MLLDNIDSPSDLKRLSVAELPTLAEEVRKTIIKTVSVTGGHLAPNLGVVELTIAMHYVFNSPKDKFVWDVGHQCYVHKLLTGRRERFGTIRQYKGISGFPKMCESEHDVFGTGHASTSISAALGIAQARDMKGENYKVLAVIGDGAMTGGMSFEALNQAGHRGTDLIVILNDNFMSISQNVGAMSFYTNRLAKKVPNWPVYNRVRQDIYYMLSQIPPEQKELVDTVRRLREAALTVLTSGLVFEELGFTYVGPIDGHDVAKLVETFEAVRKMRGPVLLHVITQKGKGCEYAEDDLPRFHGCAPFDPESGKPSKAKGKPAFQDVFGETLVELVRQDRNIVGITAAMPSGTGTIKLAEAFPENFFDVGIAEQHAVTFAAGMAANGLHPVVAVYSSFLQRAYDQLIHDVCLQNLPVAFAIDRAGIVGDDGPTHHGVFDISFLRSVPNLVILSASNEPQLQDMLYTAVKHNGPVVVRYPRGSGPGLPLKKEFTKLPMGKAHLMKDGKDVVVIGVGVMANAALEAAKESKRSVAVIDPQYLKPLDEKLIIEYAEKTGRVLTVEDGVLAGGFGSEVLELLARRGIVAKVHCLGYPDEFIEHGAPNILLAQYGLNKEGILKGIERLCGK
ncbi:1-deoxy-D-xylulose-5-phosphate synthase [Candidatus Micrarchaeota archaeon CG10_big_fil_rev_8_21_14_0_10_59_7]|nr:MAG: 1-deoxy-D-xylulose-5-phosphate synthase [Candidatus Micrarchaeota archaeon CG10_big_fil_rev_8_21_14_0_10_59_7]